MIPLDGFGISFTSVSLRRIRSTKLSMTDNQLYRNPRTHVRNLFGDLRKRIFDISNHMFIVAPAKLRRQLQRRFNVSIGLMLPSSLHLRA